MKSIPTLVIAAALGALAACGGEGDDKVGDIVERDADAAADAIDAQAETMEEAGAKLEAGVAEAQADAMREAGEGVERAIDAADIQTDNPAAAAAVVEAHSGMPSTTETLKEATGERQ